MLKNDRWITEQAQKGMLEPFQAGLVRHLDPEQRLRPVLSFCMRTRTVATSSFQRIPTASVSPWRSFGCPPTSR